MLRNIYLLPCPRFPGFLQQHLPASYKKSTFEKVWEMIPDELDDTCQRKFRSVQDFNQWVFKDWQLASNDFAPRSLKVGKSIPLYQPDEAGSYIKRQKGKMLCINDTEMTDEVFMKTKCQIIDAFESILPEKSSFEV